MSPARHVNPESRASMAKDVRKAGPAAVVAVAVMVVVAVAKDVAMKAGVTEKNVRLVKKAHRVSRANLVQTVTHLSLIHI